MGPGPGAPPPMMIGRKRGGRVNSGTKVFEEGKRAGTPVQHDMAKNDTDDMKRPGMKMHPRVVTFKNGGGVRTVTFGKKRADGGSVPMPKPRPEGKEPQPKDLYSPSDVKRLERATGGRIEAPAKGGMGPKMPGGAETGLGRLKKTRMTHHGSQV